MASNKLQEIRKVERGNSSATILAIGTANPPNQIKQSEFADLYFGGTCSTHLTGLHAKFKRICERSMIKKRHFHVTEKIVKENPEIIDNNAPSLTIRQAIFATEVPKLGKVAAEKAIKEWGQPKSNITHLIFATNSDLDVPGSDLQLVKLLGLPYSVKRFILRQGGCHAGGTLLRMAKDMAENNRGARVLVVCSEITAICFNAPNETNILSQAIFGDGAGAMIVGADPNEPSERPIFQLVSATQTTLPDSEEAIQALLREVGMLVVINMDVPKIVSKNIENVLVEAFKPVGVSDWNSIFWVAHPGGPAILDGIEAKLKLETSKLSASRNVLSEFGNMSSPTVIFILDEMRKTSLKEGKATTGEGFDWGVLFGFGPGITVETIILHSVPLHY